MPTKEAQARIRIINRLLERSGWRFFPDNNGPDNIICESRITKTVYSPAFELGNDFEKAAHGIIDYLLLNLERKPVALPQAEVRLKAPLTSPQTHHQSIKPCCP